MARRDPVGIRLITRGGNDWTQRYPLVAKAVNHLKVRLCLIDGEVVCLTNGAWPPSSSFDIGGTSRKRSSPVGAETETDLRREPIEVRKTTLASILRKSRPVSV